MFFPVTVAIDFNNRGMVDNSVDGSHRHHCIREDLIHKFIESKDAL
jgi:hypothetical protein